MTIRIDAHQFARCNALPNFEFGIEQGLRGRWRWHFLPDRTIQQPTPFAHLKWSNESGEFTSGKWEAVFLDFGPTIGEIFPGLLPSQKRQINRGRNGKRDPQ